MQKRPRVDGWVPGVELAGLGWGHAQLFKDPPAFQRAVHGPTPTVVAERNAWEVLLAAPKKKPYPLTVAIDEETGLVLRYAAKGTPYMAEVTAMLIDVEIPKAVFVGESR